MCIASVESCASAKIFMTCTRIRACSSCRWARPGHTMVEALAAAGRSFARRHRRQFSRARGPGSRLPLFSRRPSHAECRIHPGRERHAEDADAQPASALVIFLLSGGGSSIVEKPIDDEISLDDLIATYRALVHSGAPIAEINAIRKHLSAVKGGRLAQAAYPAQQVSLLVSDVPDGTPDALASGPTMPDSTTVDDCYRIAEKYDLLEQFPQSTRELFERHALDETPKSDDPAFVRARWWTVLSNQAAIEEASAAAERAGFVVHVDNSCDDWDYERAADYLCSECASCESSSRRVCLISGGEVTVKVTNGGSRRAQPAVRPGLRGEDCGREHHRAQRRHRRHRWQQSGSRSGRRWHDARASAGSWAGCARRARQVRCVSIVQSARRCD